MKLSNFSGLAGYVISNDIGIVIDVINGRYYICGLIEGDYKYTPIIPFIPDSEDLDADGWYLISRFLS